MAQQPANGPPAAAGTPTLASLPCTVMGRYILPQLSTKDVTALLCTSLKLRDNIFGARHVSYTLRPPTERKGSSLNFNKFWPTTQQRMLALQLGSNKRPGPSEMRIDASDAPPAPEAISRKRLWRGRPIASVNNLVPKQGNQPYDDIKNLLLSATYFNGQPFRCITYVSLQCLDLPELIPDYLASVCPRLHCLRLSGCGISVRVDANHTQQPSFPTSKAHTLRLENPLFRHLDIDSAKLRQAYPSVTELDIWYNVMAQGTGSTAAIGASQAADKVSSVFIPAWGTQLKRLTVGNSKAELFYERKGFFMKPTLTQWLNSLSSLTHIDLGGTFWILNDYAIDLLVRKCPQLQHVVAMGLGLQGTHTPNWQRLDLTCRHGEVHIPSVGNIDMTASGGKLHITLPEWVGQPQETCPALFFTFTDLTPGSDDLMMDKNREKALISALQSPTVAGMTVRRADGAPGAVVSIDTHEQTVLTAAIKALGKHMYGVQSDKARPLFENSDVDRNYMFDGCDVFGGCAPNVEWVRIVDKESIGTDDLQWDELYEALPKLRNVTLMCDYNLKGATDFTDLFKCADRPMEFSAPQKILDDAKKIIKKHCSAKEKFWTLTPYRAYVTDGSMYGPNWVEHSVEMHPDWE